MTTSFSRPANIATEFVACDLCGSHDQTLLYSKIDPITLGEYHLVECECGMAFVNPMPKEESVADLYPDDYLKDKNDHTELYGRMMRFLPPAAGGSLLDVGCGRGDFIQFASQRGWQVEGVDLLGWDSPHRVPIRVGDFLQMDFGESRYDVITAWALLEHVRKPSSFFRRVSGLLKDNGRFVFVVPNFQAPGMRRCCTEDIPRHLRLFSPKAIGLYLERYGMAPKSMLHDDSLYTAYPFGLVRHFAYSLGKREHRCSRYENRSVALLRNRQIKGNARAWLSEVVRSVSPVDMVIDAVDLALGVSLAKMSKIMGNYGVITVVAVKR